jgi:hypothetical protein
MAAVAYVMTISNRDWWASEGDFVEQQLMAFPQNKHFMREVGLITVLKNIIRPKWEPI